VDFSLAWELEARDVSQSELAKAAGLPQQTISDIARGVSPGRPATRRKIRAALVNYPPRYPGSPLEGRPELTVTPGPGAPVQRKPRGLFEPHPVIPVEEPEPLSHRERTTRVARNPDPGSGSGIPVTRNPEKRRSAKAEPVTRVPKRTSSGTKVAVRTFEYRNKAGDLVRVEAARTRVTADHEAVQRFPDAFVNDPRRSLRGRQR
jgi:transcriptional regulator with XRE-family HTH domain